MHRGSAGSRLTSRGASSHVLISKRLLLKVKHCMSCVLRASSCVLVVCPECLSEMSRSCFLQRLGAQLPAQSSCAATVLHYQVLAAHLPSSSWRICRRSALDVQDRGPLSTLALWCSHRISVT